MTEQEIETAKAKGEQLWLRLDLDDGWQAIMPDPDTEAHTKIILISGEEKTGDLAWWDCPCKPRVEWADKIIIHNSFQENETKLGK